MGPWHGLDRENDETGKHIVISTSLAGSCISMWLPVFFYVFLEIVRVDIQVFLAFRTDVLIDKPR